MQFTVNPCARGIREFRQFRRWDSGTRPAFGLTKRSFIKAGRELVVKYFRSSSFLPPFRTQPRRLISRCSATPWITSHVRLPSWSVVTPGRLRHDAILKRPDHRNRQTVIRLVSQYTGDLIPRGVRQPPYFRPISPTSSRFNRPPIATLALLRPGLIQGFGPSFRAR